MEQVKKMKTSRNSSTLSKLGGSYEGLKAAMAAELMLGFWFRIGAILAVKTVEYYIKSL